MSRFATLDSIKKKDGEDGQNNEYYAGGAGGAGGGGSGLNVVGADEGGDLASRIMDRARMASEQEGAGDVGDSNMVQVTFFSNGFTVGDGPLREPGVPENDRFLSEISKGYCPAELVVNGKASSIKIEDKRGEAYVPPAYIAFSGGGQTAGSASSSSSNDSVIKVSASSPEPVEVDQGQPTVRVQLVYQATRKRQVVTFNKSHTVRDLIHTINNSSNVSGSYQMLTSVRGPPKPIPSSEFDKTLTDAGLAGAAVTIKSI